MRAQLVFLALVGATGLSARLSYTPAQQWRTERRTVGDTTIVRTVGAPPNAGLRRLATVMSIGREYGPNEYIFGAISEIRRAPDGSILIFDQQVPVLRKYDSVGRFIRTVGRKGQGPGEYVVVNAVAVSASGNILLRDDPRHQIHVFSAIGEFSQSWPAPRASSSISLVAAGSMSIDTTGNAYLLRVETNIARGSSAPPAAEPPVVKSTILKLAPGGRMLDTLELPRYGVTPAVVERRGARAGRGSGIVRALLPFIPGGSWALSPHGYFIASHGDRYAIDLLLANGRVTRIERDISAVPITPAERADAIGILETSVRRADPNYRFSGPTIPNTRPPVNGLLVDDDGRVWVSVAMPGERIPDSGPAPGPPPMPPPPGTKKSSARGGGGARGSYSPDWQETYGAHFRAPVAYDVYATDGGFLGRVLMPKGVTPDIMKGDYIWAVTRDSLDVQHVIKFRIEPPLGRE